MFYFLRKAKGIFISFPFQFVLSENNLKIISIQLPEKWGTLILCSGTTSLALNCSKIQCRDYTKCNAKTDTRSARGHETYTWHWKPRTGHIPDWQQTNCKICLKNLWLYFGGNFHISVRKILVYKIHPNCMSKQVCASLDSQERALPTLRNWLFCGLSLGTSKNTQKWTNWFHPNKTNHIPGLT